MESLKSILNKGRKAGFALSGLLIIGIIFYDIKDFFTTKTGLLANFNGLAFGILLYVITFLICLNFILQFIGYKRVFGWVKKK